MKERLQNRYEFLESLNSGETTHVAIDHETGAQCVVKELTLGRVSDWKQIDLFEREALALKNLSHEAVPNYVDSFHTEGKEPRYFLVQSHVDGSSLDELLEGGPVPAEEVMRVATDILDVLVHLQSFTPPVLHRDVKPSNILRRPDGSHALVNFGSVQVELQGTVGGSTIVGTSGYMAPEQLMGKSVPSSDVYALGATLVQSMTGLRPDELPMDRMKLRWRERATQYDSRLLDIVERMVEPNVHKRFEDAEAALRSFRGGSESLTVAEHRLLTTRPSDTAVELRRTAKRLSIHIPARGLDVATALSVLLPTVLATAAIVAVAAAWLPLLIWVVPLVAIVALVALAARREREPCDLELDLDRGYRLRTPRTEGKLQAGPFSDLIGVDNGFGRQRRTLYLATEKGMFEVAAGLREKDRDWLLDEIRDFVSEQRGHQ